MVRVAAGVALAAPPAPLLVARAAREVAGARLAQLAAQALAAQASERRFAQAAQAVARVTQFLATLTSHGLPLAQDWEP